MYDRFWKRALDILLSLTALAVLLPLLLLLTVSGAIALGGSPFFTQLRPGKNEKLFRLVKFRSMLALADETGVTLPDEMRLTAYGKFLRSTSLDELPELWNILRGEMSFVGPRPQLVRDMVFMTQEQRRRHSVRPGLTGLAQCSGRNGICWEEKLSLDLQYIENLSFGEDVRILLKTLPAVLGREGITEADGTTEDLGDYLLKMGEVDHGLYRQKQAEAEQILSDWKKENRFSAFFRGAVRIQRR